MHLKNLFLQSLPNDALRNCFLSLPLDENDFNPELVKQSFLNACYAIIAPVGDRKTKTVTHKWYGVYVAVDKILRCLFYDKRDISCPEIMSTFFAIQKRSTWKCLGCNHEDSDLQCVSDYRNIVNVFELTGTTTIRDSMADKISSAFSRLSASKDSMLSSGCDLCGGEVRQVDSFQHPHVLILYLDFLEAFKGCIPSTFSFDNQEYELVTVIYFLRGHFISCIKRNIDQNSQWYYYDGMDEPILRPVITTNFPFSGNIVIDDVRQYKKTRSGTAHVGTTIPIGQANSAFYWKSASMV